MRVNGEARTAAGDLEEVLLGVLLEDAALEFDELVAHQHRDQQTRLRVEGHVEGHHLIEQHQRVQQ